MFRRRQRHGKPWFRVTQGARVKLEGTKLSPSGDLQLITRVDDEFLAVTVSHENARALTEWLRKNYPQRNTADVIGIGIAPQSLPIRDPETTPE